MTDLRARRLELTRAALQTSLETDDLERFRVVIDSLTDEFDVENVALAAVKLLHEAAGGDIAEEEIPSVAAAHRSRDAQDRDARRGSGGHDRPANARASNSSVTRLKMDRAATKPSSRACASNWIRLTMSLSRCGSETPAKLASRSISKS